MIFTSKFPAVLKNLEDKVVERGMASVSLENRTVNFTSGFVPLFKMGEVLKVVRVLGDKEIHSFTGTVYLSSRDFLQITSVHDEVLEAVGLVHSANASMLGEVVPTGENLQPPSPKGGFQLFLKKLPQVVLRPADVLVYSITANTVRFTSTAQYQKGQRLKLSTGEPLFLYEALVEVYQLIIFGDKITGYHCNFLSLSERDSSIIEEYAWEASQQSRKLF